MHKRYLTMAAVFSAVAAIAVAVNVYRPASTQDSFSSPTSPDTTQRPTQTPDVNETATISTEAGTYTDYRPGIIESTAGTKILFFHAPWCPQCRSLEASIKDGSIPADTTIIKVDYDSNQALRKTYGVTLQTTLVKVDDSGGAASKFVAYDDPSLDAVVKNLL